VLPFMENICERLTLVALFGAEYHASIQEEAEASIVGGTIYDALIARCSSEGEPTQSTLGISGTSSNSILRLPERLKTP
jgi:hypothetical protein